MASTRDNLDKKVTEANLKAKVIELEGENADLKKKLVELRKAKTTTVVKREREVIEVGQPFGRRESKDFIKLTQDDKRKDQEIEILKKKLSKAELDSKKKEEIITQLQNRVTMLEDDNSVFKDKELQRAVSNVMGKSSIKEASKVCDTEEELEKQRQEQWKLMYAKWISVTEKRLEEVQAANATLHRMIHPPHDSPSDSSTGS